MTEPFIAAPAGIPPAVDRKLGMRETVAAALMLSAAAHAGAVYWAVSGDPLREEATSAGGAVAVEVVLVQGPGAPAAGGGHAADDGDAGERSGPERSADRTVNQDASAPAAEPEEATAPAASPFAQVESPAPAAVQHAPVSEVDAPPQAAPPPPPPPKPAHAEPPREAPAQVARAAPAASTVATVPPATEGRAGAPPGTARMEEGRAAPGGSDGMEAAAALADNPAPGYPYAARLRGQHGRVLLFVEVLATGEAGAVTVGRSSGHESLDKAAAQAVQRWRFRPARRNGAPVAARVEVPIRFALQ
ncbi:MAG: TonB family protein [Alphaproteobacteria bacterium]|nr:TonB family protein [Alphaproteobacteria bacterium]